MTCVNVIAKATVPPISDRPNPLSWKVRAGFSPAHRNNLGVSEKNLLLFCGRSLLCVARSLIDRLVLSLSRTGQKKGAAASGMTEPGLPWRGRSGGLVVLVGHTQNQFAIRFSSLSPMTDGRPLASPN